MDVSIWVLLFQLWTFSLVEPLPVETEHTKLQHIANFHSELCEYVIIEGTSDNENTRGTLLYKGGIIADDTSCRLELNGDVEGTLMGVVEKVYPIAKLLLSSGLLQDGKLSLECSLKSGDIVQSCVELRTVSDKVNVHRSARNLLSSEDLQWDDTDSDVFTKGAVIGGVGVLLLLLVLVLCVKSNKPPVETVTGVRISRLSSVNHGPVSIKDVKESLAKCEASAGTGPEKTSELRNSVGTDRNSLTVDGQVGNNSTTQRPASQVSTGSADNANRISTHSQHNGKTIDRRLPQLPPNVTTPPPDDDDNPNYESVTGGKASADLDPNYQAVDDPNYDKIKTGKEDQTPEIKDPNYEKIKSEGATGGDTGQEDLYEEVKSDQMSEMYAKVDKGHQSKVKGEDTARDSTGSDLYSKVENSTGGNDAPPVPDKSDDVNLDLTPRSSPTLNRAASQGQGTASTLSPLAVGATASVTGSDNRKEPSYSELSVRESIESIKEREIKTKRVSSADTYASVDGDGDNYYSTVNTPGVSPQTPPPLPSDSTRPTSNTSSRDVNVTMTTGGNSRMSVSSEIYASIAGDGEDDPMPLYAQVNKPKRAGSASATSAHTVNINRQGRSQSERPNTSSQRSSVKGSESEPGYERIKDVMADIEPGYQAIDEVKDKGSDTMSPGDMVHIDDHKVGENFWKKKDHTYQSIKEGEGSGDNSATAAENLSPDEMVHIDDHKVKDDFWKKKDHTYQAISDDDKDTDKKNNDSKK
ncbi:uncharacterized protein LOC144440016 [Glandiceps talaboti]